MRKLNVAFLGGRILGYKCLDILKEYKDKINIKFVIAHKKDGIKGSDWNPPLLPKARQLGFTTFEPKTLRDSQIIELFKGEKIDIILNAFCNRIIPKEILDIPKFGAINFHYGKLPYYKGRFIVTHIILNNEKETTATAHFMTEEVDAGDIIFEEPVPVFQNDTAKTLYFRCTKASLINFRKVLEYLISGKELPRNSQSVKGNYYLFKEPNKCKVELDWDKKKMEKFIRATTFLPISKPWIEIKGQKYEIIIKDE